MAHIMSTWLAGTAQQAQVRKHNSVISVDTADGVTITAVEGDHADSLGRNLVALGQQVLELNGTDQDALAVRLFVEQEDLEPELRPVLQRFAQFLDSVRANPLNDLVVTELAEVDQ